MEGYVLDGILTQLRNAGLFDGAAGIVVGDIKTKWSGGIAELSARGHRRGGPRPARRCR